MSKRYFKVVNLLQRVTFTNYLRKGVSFLSIYRGGLFYHGCRQQYWRETRAAIVNGEKLGDVEGVTIVNGETVDVDTVSLLPLARSMLSRCSQWRETFHISNVAIASCETPSRHAEDATVLKMAVLACNVQGQGLQCYEKVRIICR